MTLTTTVMVMETTGALQLIVPLMITVFVAKVLLRCASTVSFNNRTVCLYVVWVKTHLHGSVIMLLPCSQPRYIYHASMPIMKMQKQQQQEEIGAGHWPGAPGGGGPVRDGDR